MRVAHTRGSSDGLLLTAQFEPSIQETFMGKLRQIAFYGKGGIGKSTTSQNTLAALVEEIANDSRVPE